MDDRIAIGVSACLLGQPVRYDGADKRSPFVCGLAEKYELVAICPEVEAGFGVPRPPIQLVRVGKGVGVQLVEGGADRTPPLAAVCEARATEIREQRRVAGLILKNRSPSCGLAVPVFDASGKRAGVGPGLFAAAVLGRVPKLPVVEVEELENPERRHAFLARVESFAKRGRA